jgi:hypothetical protein
MERRPCKPGLRGDASLAKARRYCFQERSMSGIAAIVIFLLVFAALNYFEFGRLD